MELATVYQHADVQDVLSVYRCLSRVHATCLSLLFVAKTLSSLVFPLQWA